nr:amidohydrolase [Candidatus Njordarchaeum guaymaensis]
MNKEILAYRIQRDKEFRCPSHEEEATGELKMRQADLVLFNGRVITFDEEDRRAEAVAVCGNKIAFVGSNEAAKNFIGESTPVIDLDSRVLLPGFIDAHTHFLQAGLMLDMVDLREAKSLSEALEKVRERASKTPRGEFVIGFNWDESKWPEKRYITKKDLDKVTTNHMVALVRIDGHMISVNTLVLKLIKIPSDKRGVDVDDRGEPTGVLKEEAADYIKSLSPSDPKSLRNALEKITEYAHKLGVTSVHDTVDANSIAAYLSALKDGKLKMRVCLNFTEEFLYHVLKLGLSTGFGNDKLRLGALKLFSDGSIGSRTAALDGEFADEPGNKGMLIYGKGKLEEIVAKAHKGGIQVAIHAIGDRAIELTLNAIEGALKATPIKDHRHRVEHMELVTDGQIRRVVELGIVASMQPNFIGEWGLPGDMYEKRLGRYWVEKNNPYRRILDEGAVIAFGSDCMPFSPLYGIHWAVNAPMESQRISVHEAVKCYTKNAAYASFEEKAKGSIEEGKLADMVVLSENPYENTNRIREIEVAMTIQDGEIVYRKA